MTYRCYDERGNDSHGDTLSLVALATPEGWMGVCRELGVSVMGTGSEDAIDRLKTDIAQLLIISRDEGVPAGTRMDDETFRNVLRRHIADAGPVRTASVTV